MTHITRLQKRITGKLEILKVHETQFSKIRKIEDGEIAVENWMNATSKHPENRATPLIHRAKCKYCKEEFISEDGLDFCQDCKPLNSSEL